MKKTVKITRYLKTIYVANDGTEFDDYIGALEHEYNLCVSRGELICKSTGTGKTVSYDEADFIYVKTREALEIFIAINKYHGDNIEGLSSESPLGAYFWECFEWKTPEEKIDEYRKSLYERVEKYKNNNED